jgi:hypothetical protein
MWCCRCRCRCRCKIVIEKGENCVLVDEHKCSLREERKRKCKQLVQVGAAKSKIYSTVDDACPSAEIHTNTFPTQRQCEQQQTHPEVHVKIDTVFWRRKITKHHKISAILQDELDERPNKKKPSVAIVTRTKFHIHSLRKKEKKGKRKETRQCL